jgi:predicted amidohydrolase
MRIACVQAPVRFDDPTANAEYAVRRLTELKGQNVDFAVFPEAFLTGYCVGAQDEADKIAIQSTHAALQTIEKASNDLDILAIVGFAEMENGTVYNAATLFEPGQAPRKYRKTHLPDLGLDKFVQPGQELPVFDTRLGRIGLLICFDLRPPEATRSMALQGADIIVLPTNWPEGAEVSADHIMISRAAENRVFVASCNRVGTENGFRFIGKSKIVHPTGRVLAAAGSDEEVIVADLDFADARQKRTIAIPGKYETDVFSSRRPDLYLTLTEKI